LIASANFYARQNLNKFDSALAYRNYSIASDNFYARQNQNKF